MKRSKKIEIVISPIYPGDIEKIMKRAIDKGKDTRGKSRIDDISDLSKQNSARCGNPSRTKLHKKQGSNSKSLSRKELAWREAEAMHAVQQMDVSR